MTAPGWNKVNFSCRFRHFVIFFAFAALSTTAHHAYARNASIVVDFETGRVLHAVNPDVRNYPASLTKMMTLYLAFEAIEKGRLKMTQQLPVSARAAAARPSKLGLTPGSTISAHDAILAMMTKSANDAAVVVAEALGGTEHKFSEMMTRKARDLGMDRTTYRNASGLPNRRQLSTARDMATLAKHLLTDYPEKYQLFATPEFEFDGRRYRNHNALLESYPGTDGIKTGYTAASGYNLVASTKRNGHRIIGVVFGGQSSAARNTRMTHLLDAAFADLERPGRRPSPQIASTEVSENIVNASLQSSEPLQKPELPAVVRPTGSKAGWGIQVGAFSDDAPARKAASKAASHLQKKVRKKAQVLVVPVQQGTDTIYRAQLVGLSRNTANEACRRLQSRKVSCVPVPPTSTE
jgi:D-alanyl-D-alanine carboxypeptidase